VKSVLFGYGKPANSFLPPRCRSTTRRRRLALDLAKAKSELAQSKFPEGLQGDDARRCRAQVESAIGQILQSQLKKLGITVTSAGGHEHRVQPTSSSRKYQLVR